MFDIDGLNRNILSINWVYLKKKYRILLF